MSVYDSAETVNEATTHVTASQGVRCGKGHGWVEIYAPHIDCDVLKK